MGTKNFLLKELTTGVAQSARELHTTLREDGLLIHIEQVDLALEELLHNNQVVCVNGKYSLAVTTETEFTVALQPDFR